MNISTNIVTIGENGAFRELTGNEVQKALNLSITMALDKFKYGRLLYRGVSKAFLSDRLLKSYEDSLDNTLASRLFFFGEKSAHFRNELKNQQIRKYLNDIEDISSGTSNKIFDKLNGLRKSKNDEIKSFQSQHKGFFDFFLDKSNKPMFANMIQVLGQEARDYYLGFLHTAGKFGIGEISVSVSTSYSYNQAESFSGINPKERFVIISVKRFLGRGFQVNKLTEKINQLGIPTLPDNSRIFKRQKEETLRPGIFPHDIIGINCLHSNQFIINPHIFSDRNSQVNIMATPLDIDQSHFSRKLEQQTNYSSYFYSFDGAKLHEANAGDDLE